ncbi:MAG: hypothetical protein JWO36_4683 [Myxococcales bacterium]|nr:hypothetical protein [Myxococcales bacterium]
MKEDGRPGRKQTDESLAGERAKTDAALVEKAVIEHQADAVIERARDEADEVLTTARVMADQKIDRRSPQQTRTAIVQQRAREDRALGEERAEADETLRNERAASARALARLLPIERDKTDQHLLSERASADDALASRDDFLGMVSHDLRNLLHGIVLNATMIAEAKSSDHDKLLTHALRIQRSAGLMGRLIADLVDIASIDAGKLSVAPSVADAVNVVVEAVEIWRPLAAKKEIVLEPAIVGHLSATFDHERILQVIGNLITNAVKFSARGAKILVGAAHVSGHPTIWVRDSGVGIPKDKLLTIFERFSQLGGNEHRGLGLGLYIAKCLVVAHGGEIWAESEPGVGTTVCFTIPSP